MTLRLMDSLTCSPPVQCISRSVVSSHWSGPSRSRPPQSLPSCFGVCTGSVFLKWPSRSRSGRSELSSRKWPVTRGDVPTTHCLGKYTLCCKRWFPSVSSSRQLLDICLVNVQVFHRSVSHHAKIRRMALDLPNVPLSDSKNKVHEDSASFGLIKELLADLCTMRIHETFGAPAQQCQPFVKVFHNVCDV